ncbi:hypothetical protein PHMEG_00025858 [Phytophthora megakarya]|uniref:Little elongation complex subunit 2 C-terminal domain-containing protein n=1 Tax=Phytophthora megakarya TaxID=4795 RepID=A0A225VDJ5_9STRA|nr:hypothetical protein PHMEG_00025858 [Phytophthora megakarya]
MDTTTTLAFAVPRPLFTRRKRRAEGPTEHDKNSFFSANDFASFSTRGDVHESRLYGELETRRRIIVTLENDSNSSQNSSTTMKIAQQSKHLVQLLLEAIENHHIQAPEKMSEFDNARRRVSGFSVAQHERYLMLQYKVFHAQQRGLPEVLALTPDEAQQWQHLKAEVEYEQVGFCRMIARGLAAENAASQNHVPLFVKSWYNAMLTQCWNDVYRLYPRWFEPCVAVKLPSDGGTRGAEIAALHAKEVAARGTYCIIDVKKLSSGLPLKNMPDDGGELVMDVVSPRQAISADPQAEQLMEKYDCDLAISSSTLVTLFDSDTSTRYAHVPVGWGIPMKSRAIIHEKDGSTKKRICLDRPLPGSNPSTREQIADAGRAALLSRFETDSVIEESTGGRTAYHVWQLDNKRILVRSTTHASTLSPTMPADTTPSEKSSQNEQNKQPPTTPLSIFVKPDYHALDVEEQLTTSERCRFWLHSWLRGGSTVLVARVNPKDDTVTSWRTYSPASLIYGDSTLLSLERFDPAAKFQWLSMLFTALGDVPVGNYLLRPHDTQGPSTFGKKRGGVEVLMAAAAAETATETSAVDLYSFLPKPASEEQTPALTPSDVISLGYSVLPSWNLRDRVPYTFQTGMYCLPFFLNGLCTNVSKGDSCEYIHLRLPKQKVSNSSAKTKRWRFENYTKVLKKAARSNFEFLNQPQLVTLNYAFCGEDKDPPASRSLDNLYAPRHCRKPSGQCSLPHFTLHQILERLADDLLRCGRGKRREQKNVNRQQKRNSVIPAPAKH